MLLYRSADRRSEGCALVAAPGLGRVRLLLRTEHVEQEFSTRCIQRPHEGRQGVASPACVAAERDEQLMVHPDGWAVAVCVASPTVEAHRSPTVTPLGEGNETGFDQWPPAGQQLADRPQRASGGCVGEADQCPYRRLWT